MQRIVLSIAILCAGMTAHAAGVYKHVDAQGRVTYSDTPAPSGSGRSEHVELNDDGTRLAPHLEGDAVFCGNIYLADRNDLVSLAGKLRERRAVFDQELEGARRDHARASRGASATLDPTYQRETLNRALTRLRELECAIAWIDGQHAHAADIIGAARAPVVRIDAEIAKLERQRSANCGTAPRAYDPKIGVSAEALEAVWKRCQRMYDDQVAEWQQKRARHHATVDAVSGGKPSR
jgi:hypothetical protein